MTVEELKGDTDVEERGVAGLVHNAVNDCSLDEGSSRTLVKEQEVPDFAGRPTSTGDAHGSEKLDYAFSRRLVGVFAPEAAAASSYRALQTDLAARHLADGRRGLALCAPDVGAGCTTVSANLAVACAQAGINTLLIDGNLLRPAVHDLIRPAKFTAGLAQMLLSSSNEQEDAICRDVRPNLSVLYAGDQPAKAHQMVTGRRFKEIIDHCVRSFDFTIIDTPALSEGTDARHVATSVRYVMMVARRDVTSVSDLKKGAAAFAGDRVKIVGSFLSNF